MLDAQAILYESKKNASVFRFFSFLHVHTSHVYILSSLLAVVET